MVGSRSLALCCLVILAATAGAQSAAPMMILAGVDPSGDSRNYIAPSADVSSQISPARTDIVGLKLSEDEETLNVRLEIGAVPSGTGGYMYRVNLKAGGTTYIVCWNIQYTGNVAQATQQDTLGCTRFAGVTRVGPATTTAGVQVGTDDAGSFVQWSVGRSALGGAGIADLTEVFADTWFRGASNCCVGSTGQSSYLWNQADRGPDTDFFVIDLSQLEPPGGDLNLTLATPLNNTTTVAGAPAQYTISARFLNQTVPENTTLGLDVTGLPAGWIAKWIPLNAVDLNATPDAPDANGTGDPAANGTDDGNGTADPTASNSTAMVLGGDDANGTMVLEITPPADTVNGTYHFTVHGSVDGNRTAALNLTLSVMEAVDPSLNEGQNQTATAGGKGSPGVALPVLAAATVALAAVVRRRTH